MPDDYRGPVPFSFLSIRDATLELHDFDIAPLWDWLKADGRLPVDARQSSDIVSPPWGIYAGITPPGSDEQDRKDGRRRRGVWSVLEQCFRDVVARSPEAAFLAQFADVLYGVRRDVGVLTSKIDLGAPKYQQALHAYLQDLAGRLGEDKRRILNRIDLPGPKTIESLSARFRAVYRRLGVLHADLTRRLSSPVPVASRPKRGRPGRQLLKQVQVTLHKAGFRTREISEMIIDRRWKESAVVRTKERLRSRRRASGKTVPGGG